MTCTWEADVTTVEGGQRYRLLRGEEPLTFAELFELFESDPDYAAWYTRLLAASEHAAFFWEHPPLSADTLPSPAELVLLDAPSLSTLRADASSFRPQFERQAGDVIAFPNLGGDAVLVVPRPLGARPEHAHLASFVRKAPASQVLSLWQHVGRAMREVVAERTCWLSTAGLGVPWPHVRLDSRPKYYRFGPYRSLRPSS